MDGGVFGLTSNGTNPDAMLVLELHTLRTGEAEWLFGIAGMTAGGLSVKFDDKEVWTKPYSGRAESFENWSWFWEKGTE